MDRKLSRALLAVTLMAFSFAPCGAESPFWKTTIRNSKPKTTQSQPASKSGSSQTGSDYQSSPSPKEDFSPYGLWKASQGSSMRQILNEAEDYAVTVLPESPIPVTAEEVKSVIAIMKLLPEGAIEKFRNARTGVEILHGTSVVEHPRLGGLRGRKSGYEYDNRTGEGFTGVGGYAGNPAVVVVNRVRPGSNELALLVLHEAGHTLDAVMGYSSSGEEWLKVHKQSHWHWDYYNRNPNEAFAEGFARYYSGPQIRGGMDSVVQRYFEQLDKSLK